MSRSCLWPTAIGLAFLRCSHSVVPRGRLVSILSNALFPLAFSAVLCVLHMPASDFVFLQKCYAWDCKVHLSYTIKRDEHPCCKGDVQQIRDMSLLEDRDNFGKSRFNQTKPQGTRTVYQQSDAGAQNSSRSIRRNGFYPP